MNTILKAGIALLVLAPLTGHATLLVYEGFTGYGSTLTDTAPNANTIGLDTANYTAGSGQLARFTVLSSGLTFGSLLTSGGALSSSSSTAVATVRLDLSGGDHTGTLWSSYLVRFAASPASGSTNYAYLRALETTNATSEHFASYADSRYKSPDSTEVGVSYGAGSGSDSVALGGATLAGNTTYILISRFTNVGTPLSSENPGVATTWALTEAQFEAFVEAGRSESYLDSGSIGSTFTAKATSLKTTPGTYTFKKDSYVSLLASGLAGTTLDEMRWGGTLADVTPIPEPASLALLAGLGGLGIVAFRRRHRS